MNNIKPYMISSLYALVPFVPLAWIYSILEDHSLRAFCKGLGVFVAAKLLFGIIEMIGSTVAWRLHGRDRLISQFVEFLTINKLPPLEVAQDNLANYLAKLEDKKSDESIRRMATEIKQARMLMDNSGLLTSIRYEAAWKAALNIYSAKE